MSYAPHVGNPMQKGRWTCQNVANTIQNGRWTCPLFSLIPSKMEGPNMPKCGKYHTKLKVNMLTCSNIPCKMEGEHAQMWQIPCKMTNSSSKPLQTLGKWYQPRNPKKKFPNLLKEKILKLFHTLMSGKRSGFFLWLPDVHVDFEGLKHLERREIVGTHDSQECLVKSCHSEASD